ncbi:cell division protein PerM [Leucobacter sp. HY1908]
MRAIITAVVAAIEGCAAALAGIALIALPALLLWVVTFGIAAEPSDVAAAVAGTWLLAHLVPMQFELSQETMLGMGLGQDALTFTLSLAPLAITLVSVAFAVRAGRRLSRRGRSGAAGIVGGTAGFAAVAWGVATVAGDYSAWPSAAAVAVPALVYLAPAAVSFAIAAAVGHEHWWSLCVRGMQRGLEFLGVQGSVAAFPARAATVARLTAGALAGVITVAAVALAVALAAGFADVIAIAQALQLDMLGSLLLFLAQLALLPVGVIWALAWLSGAGFVAGGAFSPFHDTAASLPSLPILGALPSSWGSFGALAPVLLVLANLAVGVLLAQSAELRRASWPIALALPMIAAACTGLAVAGLAALGSGSLGPGQLAATGPAPWVTGGLVAAEVAVGLVLGVAAVRLDYSRVREVLPEPVARWSAARADRAAGSASAGFAGAGFAEAETVDLSAVRDERSLHDDYDTEPAGAPVVDLFAEVLHEPVGARADDDAYGTDSYGTDSFDTEALDTEALDSDSFDSDSLDTDVIASDALNAVPSDGEPLDTGEVRAAAGDPEQAAAPERAEDTAFDIETMKDTGEVPEPAAPREGPRDAGRPGERARSALEDAEAIERAFAWDANDSGGLDDLRGGGARARDDSGSDDAAAGSESKRGRFLRPNWRGSRK